MSFENANDTLKRRVEALEQVVESLQEKNQSCEIEIKRLRQDSQINIMESMENLHESLKNRHFRIEKLIQNPGLQHIALSIFKELDPKSLGNCRLVSKEWKACIDQDKYWWHLQLIKCKEIMGAMVLTWNGGEQSLEKRCPEFMKTMDYIYEKESVENLEAFATFMLCYRKKLIKNENKYHWDTPLHFAADQNRMDIFDMLVKSPHLKDMNVDNFYQGIQYEGRCQRTLLGKACTKNQVEVIKYFINQNLEGNQTVDFNRVPSGPWGFSLFHNACDSNNIEVVKLFLDHADKLGINLNARLRSRFSDVIDGKTPIMCVMKPEVMKLLLADERIDVNATDDEGHTVLFYVVDNEDPGKKLQDQEVIDTISLLMSPTSRFDPTIDERNGCTALHIALSWRDEFAEVILKHALTAGIDVNCRDPREGETPAHCAFRNWAEYECFDSSRSSIVGPVSVGPVLKYAKEVGIDFEMRDNRGRTPMHYMCKDSTKRDVYRFLIIAKQQYEIEFNLEATDEDGKTPFELFKKDK